MRVKIRFAWAALLTLLPLIALLRSAGSQPVIERPVATHWTLAGIPDGYQDQSEIFWGALVPTIFCTIIAVTLVITLDQSVGRWSAASAFGTLALVGAAAVQLRSAILTTAMQPELGDRLGSPFLTLLWAVPWGLIAFWIACARRPVITADPATTPEPAD